MVFSLQLLVERERGCVVVHVSNLVLNRKLTVTFDELSYGYPSGEITIGVTHHCGDITAAAARVRIIQRVACLTYNYQNSLMHRTAVRDEAACSLSMAALLLCCVVLCCVVLCCVVAWLGLAWRGVACCRT
jgi:hypothetical protein